MTSCFLSVISFIYSFVYLKGREMENERRENPLLVHSPNAYKGRRWAKLERENAIQVSQLSGRNSINGATAADSQGLH